MSSAFLSEQAPAMASALFLDIISVDSCWMIRSNEAYFIILYMPVVQDVHLPFIA
jgi:hypothetical protein